MAFERILFVPAADNLELPGGQALLAVAGPGTQVDVFEPVYSTDLQDYAAVDGEAYERAREELVKKRLERVEGLVDDLKARGIDSSVTAAWDHPVHEAISALVSLGLKPQEASRQVHAIDGEGRSSEELIRLALQTLVK